MEVRITGRHAHLGEKVKAYTVEKLGPLSRYYDRTRHLEVVFDEQNLGWKVEVLAHISRSDPLIATVNHKDPMAAIDLAHDKLERLLSREKDRRRSHRREGRAMPPPSSPDGRPTPSEEE